MLLDDPLNHRQPEAGSLADLLGGEERLEDARPHLIGHALAGVGDRQPHVLAGAGLAGIAAGVGRGHLDRLGRERQRAPLGHGVAGVQAQVHERLGQERRVGLDRTAARARP